MTDIADVKLDGKATPARSLLHTLGAFRFGSSDPTVRLTPHPVACLPIFTSTSVTRSGASWISVSTNGRVSVDGTGKDHVHAWNPDPTGGNDTFVSLQPAHPIVDRLQHDFGHVRIGGSRDVYRAALVATLGQRITAGEAVNQWRRLCFALGDPVDTPAGVLQTPPVPDRLAQMAPYQLHRFGIEAARATTLIAIGKVFTRAGAHLDSPDLAFRRLAVEVPRFGPWTRALVAAEAFGDPDAVPVGDFHVKNVVAHALAGTPRGTDDAMLATLAPYAGQRGRVIMWLALAGIAAPKFGPRRTNPDIRSL